MPKHYKHWKDVPASEWRWPNFKPSEIACKGDGSLIVHEEALDKLQALRTRLGRPLRINSAYRSPAYNARIEGSSKASKHMEGRAFDVALVGVTREELAAAARAVGLVGVGHYASFLHLDTGPERTFDMRKKE
jgi:zinc D-Ala-D-Ala carboxypeptidase